MGPAARIIQFDTNFLILSLVPGTAEAQRVASLLAAGEDVGISTMAWAEFLCGPVTPAQLAATSALLPSPIPVTPEDAARAAELFNETGRRRGSLPDCLIAAACLRLDATLATNNTDDFRRFEPHGLRLLTP